MEEDLHRLADHVVSERVRRGWELGELADRTGVSDRTLSKLERGQRVSRDTWAAIEHAFNWRPGTCRTIAAGGEPLNLAPEPAPDTGLQDVSYPKEVRGDPFLEYIWRYEGDTPRLSLEKRVAVKAIILDRQMREEEQSEQNEARHA
jgi:transcriptional regulator with XRE-family HTH domain